MSTHILNLIYQPPFHQAASPAQTYGRKRYSDGDCAIAFGLYISRELCVVPLSSGIIG
jgi:hypothetical protein